MTNMADVAGALVGFIDEKIENVLDAPQAWGGLEPLEPLILALLMCRQFTALGDDDERGLIRQYRLHLSDSVGPGSARLMDRPPDRPGRLEIAVDVLRKFAEAQRERDQETGEPTKTVDTLTAYKSLARELLVKRSLGLLSTDDQAEIAEDLDALWRRLEDHEQQAIEEWLKSDCGASRQPEADAAERLCACGRGIAVAVTRCPVAAFTHPNDSSLWSCLACCNACAGECRELAKRHLGE